MTEPKRDTDIRSLVSYVRDRVAEVMKQMILRGFDPILFEARRSAERQKWLYGVGRTHSLDRDKVTFTLKSKHMVGKAADIVSHSTGWSNKAFFDALEEEAAKVGLKTLGFERCHVEWQG